MFKQFTNREVNHDATTFGWFQDLCGVIATVLTAMFLLDFLHGLSAMTLEGWLPAGITFLIGFAMWFVTGVFRRIG